MKIGAHVNSQARHFRELLAGSEEGSHRGSRRLIV
jgi:hypothetical protein